MVPNTDTDLLHGGVAPHDLVGVLHQHALHLHVRADAEEVRRDGAQDCGPSRSSQRPKTRVRDTDVPGLGDPFQEQLPFGVVGRGLHDRLHEVAERPSERPPDGRIHRRGVDGDAGREDPVDIVLGQRVVVPPTIRPPESQQAQNQEVAIRQRLRGVSLCLRPRVDLPRRSVCVHFAPTGVRGLYRDVGHYRSNTEGRDVRRKSLACGHERRPSMALETAAKGASSPVNNVSLNLHNT